ncbi:serine/threonine protein kinase [Legionella busanensis]|uniref:Serine/threonine protein kinase n=1 Tax=Legionella busanensis TaxID=190655 RepID=A0A378JNP3_9GAMM|nr:protein kinase family protein [Legionella busanensis]STX52875.1 serine/threonine protein kinase [Legionella busanensis]
MKKIVGLSKECFSDEALANLSDIQTLNRLIEDHEKEKAKGLLEELLSLKRIQIQTKIIYRNYYDQHVTEDLNFHLFYIWRFHHKEFLESRIQEILEQFPEKILMEMPSPPESRVWANKTTGLKISLFNPKRESRDRWRSEQYREVDSLLDELHREKNRKEEVESEEAGKLKEQRLHQLEEKIVAIILNDIPDKKEKMFKRFHKLQVSTNAALARLFRKMAVSSQGPDSGSSSDIFIHPDHSNFNDFITKLSREQADVLLPEGFNLHYIGGNNNRNWLATHSTEVKKYVVRVEKASGPITDYILREKIIKLEGVSQYIARDIFYYPTEYLQSLGESAVNIAISEYCPRGNLKAYRQAMELNDFPMISAEVLRMTQQLATMASALAQNNMAYMDIKSENFLIRDNDDVITADLKSIVLVKEGKVPKNSISTTPNYAPSEYHRMHSSEVDPKPFMVYQIGLVLYDLAANLNAEDKNELAGQLYDYRNEENKTFELDFSAPIFSTSVGMQIQELITSMINIKSKERPTLDDVIQACEDLRKQCNQSKESSITIEKDLSKDVLSVTLKN